MGEKRRTSRNRRFRVTVLESIKCRVDHEWTARELANHSQIHPSAVGIGLKELLDHGWIEQIPGEPKKYKLIPKEE